MPLGGSLYLSFHASKGNNGAHAAASDGAPRVPWGVPWGARAGATSRQRRGPTRWSEAVSILPARTELDRTDFSNPP